MIRKSRVDQSKAIGTIMILIYSASDERPQYTALGCSEAPAPEAQRQFVDAAFERVVCLVIESK